MTQRSGYHTSKKFVEKCMVWRETWWPFFFFFFGSYLDHVRCFDGYFWGGMLPNRRSFFGAVYHPVVLLVDFFLGGFPQKDNHLLLSHLSLVYHLRRNESTKLQRREFLILLPPQDSTQACLSCNWPCGRKARGCGFPDMGRSQVQVLLMVQISGEFSHRLDV